nr:DUF1203 domain-containing protein [Polymorphobacter sp.]
MSFRITGLSPEPFRHLYGLSDADLGAHGVTRHTADKFPGFPDRIEVRDAAPGETLLLLNHVHQPADTAYRASHAIFVREGAEARYDATGEIPEALRVRTISLRGFDDGGNMTDAALVDGGVLDAAIDRMFGDPAVAYLHAHYAVRGCYAARVDRA